MVATFTERGPLGPIRDCILLQNHALLAIDRVDVFTATEHLFAILVWLERCLTQEKSWVTAGTQPFVLWLYLP